MPPIGRASHHRSQLFRAAPVVPGRCEPPPRLVVGELNGGELAGRLHAGGTVGNVAGVRVCRLHRGIPALPQVDEPRGAPLEILPAERIARVRCAGQLEAGRILEVLPAVHAVAVASLRRPPVREDAVDLVPGHDLAVHLVHELEVVRAECARDPELGVRPVAHRFAVAVHRNPVRMGLSDLVADRVRVRPRHDVHLHRPAALDQLAERIARAQPRAPVMEGDLGRVIRHDPAGTQRGGVGVQPAEIVEPEGRVEAPGIVFDQGQLNPSHRPVEPARGHFRRGGGRGLRGVELQRGNPAGAQQSARASGYVEKVTAAELIRHRCPSVIAADHNTAGGRNGSAPGSFRNRPKWAAFRAAAPPGS